MFQVRTDLAIENREMCKEGMGIEISGVKVDVEEEEHCKITRVEILNEEGEKKLGKKVGNYITIESAGLKQADQELKDDISKVVAKELKALIKPTKTTKSLVVGLGNWNVTPDALGPKVVKKVFVTRHFFKAYQKDEDDTMSDVSAISPGVMGITGLETGEIIKGIVEKSHPDVVIAVDALASRKLERVSTTIQISDTGINPGAGVGNNRKSLNEEYLGVPVYAIGVPTVVDAATMVNDTIGLIVEDMKNHAESGGEFYEMLEELEEQDKYQLISQMLTPYMGNLMVTPKEVDSIIDDISLVIANGLNVSLHHGIDLKDINRYVN